MLDDDQIQEFKPEVHTTGPQRHKEANTSLFLGIVAIVLAAGALGLACAIFSMIAGSRTLNDYKENPTAYTRNSYTRAVAGITCSIVSVVLLIVLIFLLLTYFDL